MNLTEQGVASDPRKSADERTPPEAVYLEVLPIPSWRFG